MDIAKHTISSTRAMGALTLLALLGSACASRPPCPALGALDAYRAEVGQDLDDLGKTFATCIVEFEMCAMEDDLEPVEIAGQAFCEASLEYAMGSPDRAIAALDEGLAAYPDEVLLWHVKTHVAMSQGDIDAAMASAEQEVALAPDWKWAWLDIAMTYMEAGMLEQAEERILRYIEMDPDSSTAFGMLGFLRMGMGYMAEIWLGNLVKAVELAPDDPAPLLDLYDVLTRAGAVFPGPVFAFEDLLVETEQKMLEMLPGDVNLLMEMAFRRFEMHGTARARELVMMVLALAPDSPAALEGLLVICEKSGDCAGESETMKRITALPVDEATHLGTLFAELLVMQGRDDLAYGWALEMLALDPALPDMLMIVATHQMDACLVADALDAAAQAVALAPDDSINLLRQGAILLEADMFEQVEANVQKVLDADPQNAWGWALKSHVLYEQGMWEESLALLDKAIGLGPEVVPFRIQRADTLFLMGRVEEAVQVVEEACADPDLEASCLSMMGTLKAAQGDPLEGLSLLDKAIGLEPDNPNILVYKAWVVGQLEKSGDADKGAAKTIFMQAMTRRPSLATKAWVHALMASIPGMKKTKLEMGPMTPCP